MVALGTSMVGAAITAGRSIDHFRPLVSLWQVTVAQELRYVICYPTIMLYPAGTLYRCPPAHANV